MRNGKKIRIKDMTDSHLLNTIAMLERMYNEERNVVLSSYPWFNREMAQYYAEKEWDMWEAVELDAEVINPLYPHLIMEAARRELC